mgnify:CR=1 FL=1
MKSFNTQFLFFFFSCCILPFASAQISFTTSSSTLGGTGVFSFEDCAVDMNGDYLDDVVRVTSNSIYIDFQQEDGTFIHQEFPINLTNVPSWSLCAGDLNEDGRNDLLIGDGNALSFVYANADGSAYEEVAKSPYIFCQRTTMADIDNDGDLDAFICHDVDLSHPYRNDGSGNMTLDQSLIETADLPGNYAAIWCDYDNDSDIDLYITKCRGESVPGDIERTNLLYQNDGNGVYTEVGEAANMNDNDQSWATTFEDYDNDGDFDAFIVNHYEANRFMLNNGDGTFTDIIDQTGIDKNDLGAWENASADFNNDGFVDILSELNDAIYLNNGDLTFTGIDLAFDDGGIGDFNNDGFLDVVNSNTIHFNDGNDNNWVKINTLGIISNKNGIGARVEIHGSWGTQIREVRSGESFSPMSSLTTHFGIGEATSIDQIVVKWPSGIVTTLDDPGVNDTYTMIEAECLLPGVTLTVIGDAEICPGETVEIVAPAGYGYQWNNGSDDQSITIGESGTYNVTMFSLTDSCVALSNNVEVTVLVDEVPEISLSGKNVICEGETAVLTASNGVNYVWSDGTTGATLEVTTTGAYSVMADAVCSAGQVSSEAIDVTVEPAPIPVITDIANNGNGTYTITATGDNLQWYDQPSGGSPINSGLTFSTPDLMGSDTDYYVESINIYGGGTQSGGKLDNTGGGGLPASGGWSYFDAFEPFTISKVTVYVPSNAPSGDRTIRLVNESGTTLDQIVVNLGTGEHILDLDFEVPEGTDFSLRCSESNLFRNNGGVSYPYAIGDVGIITGSNNGGIYYYYFYNWEIAKEELQCVSDRVEVAVLVGVSDIPGITDLSVYPNPVSDKLFVDFTASESKDLELKLYDVVGHLIWQKSVTTSSATQTESIDLTELAKGAYQLQVEAEGVQQTFKVVVL